jgi:hypothetical protein
VTDAGRGNASTAVTRAAEKGALPAELRRYCQGGGEVEVSLLGVTHVVELLVAALEGTHAHTHRHTHTILYIIYMCIYYYYYYIIIIIIYRFRHISISIVWAEWDGFDIGRSVFSCMFFRCCCSVTWLGTRLDSNWSPGFSLPGKKLEIKTTHVVG